MDKDKEKLYKEIYPKIVLIDKNENYTIERGFCIETKLKTGQDVNYIPELIFGQSNTFRLERLCWKNNVLYYRQV